MSELLEMVEERSEVKKKKTEASVEFKDNFAILDNYFRVPTGTYKILKRNIEKGVSSMLIGGTGQGKSELAFCMGAVLGIDVIMMDMGTMVDPIMGLVGTRAIKIKGSQSHSTFIKSRFSQAIQKPGIVVLDEISRANVQATNLLFPVLDFRKELSMEYSFDNSAPVKVHPKCVFIATANMGSQYTGTHKLDRALVDRFMMIEIDPLEKKEILDVIKYHYPKVMATEREKIVDCYININKEHDDYKINFNLSLRHLKMIASLIQDGFTIYDSFYAICKGIGSKEGLKSLETILKSVV